MSRASSVLMAPTHAERGQFAEQLAVAFGKHSQQAHRATLR